MAEILNDKEIEPLIETFTLVPADGGKFEFSIDDELLYSKKQLGRHAEENEVYTILKKHLAEA